MNLYDRFYGCLLGGACGDALGAPVEFLNYGSIIMRCGAPGIRHFDIEYDKAGQVTDDTQMTLFTVDGLIRSCIQFIQNGDCVTRSAVHRAYRRWLATQDSCFAPLNDRADLDGWLIKDERLWARRAPGNTCLKALHENTIIGQFAKNDSKGCGTVMRDAPFGLMWFRDAQTAFSKAAESAALTHGHPSAHYSSAAMASIIAFIVQGETLPLSIHNTMSMLARQPGASEVYDALEKARSLSASVAWETRISELGAGWVAEEALAISVLCALAAEAPESALVSAVNHSGDSDSTGAITGNIVGAYYGAAKLPCAWVGAVEFGDVIETLATDLVTVEAATDVDQLGDTLITRFPTHR